MNRFLDTFIATAAALTASNTSDELCCVFARDWTRAVYGGVVDKAPNSLWCLYPESKDAWGPVTACFTAGIAEPNSRRDDGVLTPGRWHRVQGWRGTPFAAGVTGHTITVYGNASGYCLVFDSAKDRNDRVTRQSWEAYKAQFKGGLALCVLKEPS